MRAAWGAAVLAMALGSVAQATETAPAGTAGGLESQQLERLRELAQAGKFKAVLERTVGRDLSKNSFEYQREVLSLQAEAFRRTGEPHAAMSTLYQLMRYAQKLPAFRREEEVNRVLFPIGLYRRVRNGKYISPRKKPPTATAPAEQGWPIADDEGWERAKEDYARYLLGRLDGRLRVVENSTNPTKLFGEMLEMLDGVDGVRPHMPDLANKKVVFLAAAMVKAFDKAIEGKRCLDLAQRLVNGRLWPRGVMMSLVERNRTAERIVKDVGELYLVNYRLGNRLTDYARKHKITEEMDGPLSVLSDRREALQSAFVQVDSFVERKHRIRRLGDPPPDPLNKIPTGKW
ncbi:MAG: hypothetical protein AMK72_11480 [Planctomycetes bacterium SM23_25]|nr:MAG: hypothetical protein AMK72_11480 [Planctomycetes bacterium SM23_25]